MVKLIFRIIASLFFVLALVYIMYNITHSTDSLTLEVFMTPLGRDWYNFSPTTLNSTQSIIQRYMHPAIWDPGIQTALQMPGWLVLGLLALTFYLAAFISGLFLTKKIRDEIQQKINWPFRKNH